jgi:hypothetical protein
MAMSKSVRRAKTKTGRALRQAASGALNELGGKKRASKMVRRAAAAAIGELTAELFTSSANKAASPAKKKAKKKKAKKKKAKKKR